MFDFGLRYRLESNPAKYVVACAKYAKETMSTSTPVEDQERCLETAREPAPPQNRKTPLINWYRSPIEPKLLKSLHKRSDWRGFLQTGGYLGLITLTASAVLYSGGHWPVAVTVALLFLHGTFYAFMINGIHELGHGTVFKTKALNAFFDRFLSFLGWQNFEMFEASHVRHHRYTLHQPDDLEVVLPTKHLMIHFFKWTFVNPKGAVDHIRGVIKKARGEFGGEWELVLFPEGSPERARPVNWARTMLAGHAVIIAVSIYFKLWLLPLVITFAPFYGSWLQSLCNNTQHAGLQDDVPDFRLCCRTVLLNPFVQFLYWHMNYHIEHHMYAAVPCYNLGRLHKAIEHECLSLLAQELADGFGQPDAGGLFPRFAELLPELLREIAGLLQFSLGHFDRLCELLQVLGKVGILDRMGTQQGIGVVLHLLCVRDGAFGFQASRRSTAWVSCLICCWARAIFCASKSRRRRTSSTASSAS